MKTKASKKLTAKNVNKSKQLWQKIPQKDQAMISGGFSWKMQSDVWG